MRSTSPSIHLQKNAITTLIVSSAFYLWWSKKDRILQIFNSFYERRALRLLASQTKKDDSKKDDEEEEEEEGKMRVSGLFIYPVKSLQSVSLSSTRLDSFGFANDRRIMIVRPVPSRAHHSYDENSATHRFVTQRQCPILATISTSIQQKEEKLVLSLECQGKNIQVDISPKTILQKQKEQTQSHIRASVWDDVVTVVDLGDEISTFISAIMQLDPLASKEDLRSFENIRVVSMSHDSKIHSRPINESYIPPSAYTKWGFNVPDTTLNDGFPILITSESSLAEVNARLKKSGKEPIQMNRFRPNLVVKGGSSSNLVPFEEDTWKAIQINNVILYLVKGCPRCKQSCTDQSSGERYDEPLEVLSSFRKMNKRGGDDVYFGQNAVFIGLVGDDAQNKGQGGVIRVGDEVKILTRGDAVWDKEDVQAE